MDAATFQRLIDKVNNDNDIQLRPSDWETDITIIAPDSNGQSILILTPKPATGHYGQLRIPYIGDSIEDLLTTGTDIDIDDDGGNEPINDDDDIPEEIPIPLPPLPPPLNPVTYRKLIDTLNQDNDIQLRVSDWDFAGLTIAGTNSNGLSTVILRPKTGTGNYGQLVINYERTDIADVLSSYKRIIKTTDALFTSSTNLSDIIPAINSAYGLVLEPEDYIDVPLPISNSPTEIVTLTITCTSNSVLYKGSFVFAFNYIRPTPPPIVPHNRDPHHHSKNRHKKTPSIYPAPGVEYTTPAQVLAAIELERARARAAEERLNNELLAMQISGGGTTGTPPIINNNPNTIPSNISSLSVDWVNYRINVAESYTTLLIQDLYDFARICEASKQGRSRDLILGATGKFNITSGVLEGLSLNINAPWQIAFAPGQYQAYISGGNIAGAKGWNPFAYTPGVHLIVLLSDSSTIVEVSNGSNSSLIPPTAPEIAAEVWSTDTSSYIDRTTFGGFIKSLVHFFRHH